MLLTYKYRLNCEARQHRALERILEQQRQIEIACLAQRLDAYKALGMARCEYEFVSKPRRRADGSISDGYYSRRHLATVTAHDLSARFQADAGSAHRFPTAKQVEGYQRGLHRKAEKDRDKAFEKASDATAHSKARAAYAEAISEIPAKVARFAITPRFSLSNFDQSAELTKLRADDPAYALVQRRVQRHTINKVQKKFDAFFKGAGFPKFPRFDDYHGFSFDAWAQIRLDGDRLRFDGMAGGLRVHFDRPLPTIVDSETGEAAPSIKNVWFKGDMRRTRGFNRWYVGFQVEVMPRADRAGLGTGAIGVDWGTSVLAALSSGEMVPNPRPGEALAKDLARAQRAVSRKQRGSKRRLKARRHLQAVNRRIANRRRNVMDKLSARLVKHFGLIAVERVDAKALMNAERAGETLPVFVKTRRNREALDAAPYMLRQMTAYKARRELAEVIEIDPAEKIADGTRAQPTQRCSMCGRLHFKELTDDHVCTTPGPFQSMRLPRKTNAARVVLSLALDGYGISSHVDDNRGGTVPGGLDGSDAAARNAGTGPRRLGNTEEGQPSPGRRGQSPLLTHVRGARDPRLRRSSGW